MTSNDIDQAKENFNRLKQTEFDQFMGERLSESDTRSKLIDCILIEVLGWQESHIKREERETAGGGYLDYKLSTTHPVVVIEAKKSDISFELPESTGKRAYKVGGVIKECKALYDAMMQARDYAVSKGVTYCCVSNGYEFVFFRSQNTQGIDWDKHIAKIFRSHDDIYENFKEFYELLSYESISNGRLAKSLPLTNAEEDSIKKYKKVPYAPIGHLRTRERNTLFPYLREIITKVFQDLASEESDSEILEHCYVTSPRDSSYERGLGDLLRDRANIPGLTVEDLEIKKKNAGNFQRKISAAISNDQKKSEVLLLLGGVGAGKSTFIQRFRKVLAKDEIEKNTLWIYINFKKFSDTGERLIDWVSAEIEEIVHEEYPDLDFDSWKFLKQVYHKEYEKLKRGRLAPIYESSMERFEERFADHLEGLMKDKETHVLNVLKKASSLYSRRIFLVFDNADQFNADTQNKVFLLAQKTAEVLGCSSVIALREESYWRNKDFGALSAFHSIAYHVQPPRLSQVVSKRFQYARSLLGNLIEDESVDLEGGDVTAGEIEKVFEMLVKTVLGEDRRYIDFVEYLSSNDTRRALDFVARFLYSGHTNINSLLKAAKAGGELTIGFHEFVTSITLGDNEYFSDGTSDIVNLFGVDGHADASNFNRLSVLARLRASVNEMSDYGSGFIPIATVVDDCQNLGIQPDTTMSILNFLNQRRIVETETQIKDEIVASHYVRMTSAAEYYIQNLSYDFTYLDLILSDTPIANVEHYKNIEELTEAINREPARLNRIDLRLNRVGHLIEYLDDEYSGSSLAQSDDRFDDTVKVLISNLKESYPKARKQIFESARTIFKHYGR